METAGYAILSRQTGLVREMQIIANNVANANTSGFRQQGLLFSEYIQRGEVGSSLSMSEARVRNTLMTPGPLEQTDGRFDLAIEGDGFFLVETPNGERLTRSGSFSPNAAGDLVTADGFRVLDSGRAPVFVPPSPDLSIASDGTISSEGQPIGQVGVFAPLDPLDLQREDGVMFATGDVENVVGARILQGFVEGSNVNPIEQISRMIEVQRSYELGQSFLKAEDERIRQAVKTLIR